MSEHTIEQGKSWVIDVFEQVREQYRETVPVDTMLPWRGGHTFGESQEEHGSSGVVTYYLAFEIGQETQYIPFTRQELLECADPDNSEARFAVKKKMLDTFTSLESQ